MKGYKPIIQNTNSKLHYTIQHLADKAAAEAAIKAKAVDWKEAVVVSISTLQANSLNSCSERCIDCTNLIMDKHTYLLTQL